MGWVWSKKTTSTTSDTPALLGLDLNSNRLRAAMRLSGNSQVLPLSSESAHLPLSLGFENRTPDVGHGPLRYSRRLPHLFTANFLPHLGRPTQYKCGRFAFDAAGALKMVFERIRDRHPGYANWAITTPAHLSLAQAGQLTNVLRSLGIPLAGTASNALALAAEHAANLLTSTPVDDPQATRPEGHWVVPMRKPAGQERQASVIIVDADDHAITGTLVQVTPERVQTMGSVNGEGLGVKRWTERLLDALADRCVRICRRDPRDDAESEQSLFDQIDSTLDRALYHQRAVIAVRAGHWYQDLNLNPEDLEAICDKLARQALTGLNELLHSTILPEPPKAVWLTYEAARLPGLAKLVHDNLAERTQLLRLAPEAESLAAAHLAERWRRSELPPIHLDTTIPLNLAKPMALPSGEREKAANYRVHGSG